jgi:hypothetical protein
MLPHLRSHNAEYAFRPSIIVSPERREVAAQKFSTLLDLGAAGMLYDECMMHHWPSTFCFDPTRSHRVPAYIFGGDVPFPRSAARFSEHCRLRRRGTYMLVTPEAPEMQPTGDTVSIPARLLAVVLEI